MTAKQEGYYVEFIIIGWSLVIMLASYFEMWLFYWVGCASLVFQLGEIVAKVIEAIMTRKKTKEPSESS